MASTGGCSTIRIIYYKIDLEEVLTRQENKSDGRTTTEYSVLPKGTTIEQECGIDNDINDISIVIVNELDKGNYHRNNTSFVQFRCNWRLSILIKNMCGLCDPKLHAYYVFMS